MIAVNLPPLGSPFEPSTLDVHCICLTIPSGPVISSHIIGPISGAASVRGPIRLAAIVNIENTVINLRQLTQIVCSIRSIWCIPSFWPIVVADIGVRDDRIGLLSVRI